MNPQKNNMSVLAQISSWIPDRIADNLAKKYGIQTRSFGPFSHATAMMYAHLAHSLSLNDLCDDLHNHAGTLEQIRGCTPPSRNGLSYANRTRNANMAQDLFWATYESLEKRFPEFLTTSRNYPGLPYRFKNRTVRAVDSTTISLTAESMCWAKHRNQKAAAKMHTALNMCSFLPNYVIVKSAKDSDSKTAWELCADMKAGEVVVFDKAYVDFKHLWSLSTRGVFWVTRAKENMQYTVMGQHASETASWIRNVSKTENCRNERKGSSKDAEKDMGQHASGGKKHARKKCRILSDDCIELMRAQAQKKYKQFLRLIVAEVEVKGKMVEMRFLTNNLDWSPVSVCQLYQCRWGIEVFFKEIKQTLQLADFLGYNENAVRWQVWMALLAYLLLRFIAWYNNWKHHFSRLFTLLRAVLWNFFTISSVIECCDTPRVRRAHIRGSPETAYQPCFVGFE
jgi:hypothetical protein